MNQRGAADEPPAATESTRGLHERVVALLRESAATQGELARAVGITQPGISRWLKPRDEGGVEPDETNLERAAAFFTVRLGRPVTPQWLRYGTTPRAARVPILTWAQAAIARTIVDNDAGGPWPRWLETSVPVGRHTFATLVQGDLMVQPAWPSFPEGTAIVVEPEMQPEHGDFVLVVRGLHEPALRQLVVDGGAEFLKPLNDRYPILQRQPGDLVVGVVRELTSRLK